MNKHKLETLVKEDATLGVPKEFKSKVLGWIGALPAAGFKTKPIKLKRGDVYMHPVFRHPCVFLEKRDGYWICGLLTTEPTCSEILEPCKSRFFSDNYFTRVMYTQVAPIGSFMNPFDNPKQIREVTKKLKFIFE